MKNKININVEKSTQENKRNRHHINIHEFNKYNDKKKKKRCSYFPIRLRLSLCKKKLTNRPNFYTISLSYQHLY